MPLSRSASSGTVISDSTSALERPSDSFVTVSESGENSGMMSSGLFLRPTAPRINRPAATTTTRLRKRKLKEMSHANISDPPSLLRTLLVLRILLANLSAAYRRRHTDPAGAAAVQIGNAGALISDEFTAQNSNLTQNCVVPTPEF